MEKITKIAQKLGIDEDYLDLYGKYKAKIDYKYFDDKLKNNKDGKLVLVTAVNPTPLGEGKTTQSIALSMGLNKLGKKSIVALREPSLGPVFGIKGGAIGGGKVTVEPGEDINLHFTGDFHAITSANNLLCAVLENHIYQGNSLNIDVNNICIKRVMDMNDRALRSVIVGVNGKTNGVEYKTGFDITVASEIMAICCLANNKDELKEMLSNITVAYTLDKKPVYAKDLKVVNAMMALLKDVLSPNLVQTSENTPAIIHLGPFANIAHGCNSIIATKMVLKLSDIVVTEAGFGADLGAEKFFDIKCRKANLKPDLVVLVVTTKAIKYNGGVKIEDISNKNIDALKSGIANLGKHIENITKFGMDLVVCINKYENDFDEEIEYIEKYLNDKNVKSNVSTAYMDGSDGILDLSKTVIEKLKENNSNFKYIYDLNETIKEKMHDIATKIYGASDVIYKDKAIEKIKEIENLKMDKLPICVAKTPMSLSDDKNLLGCPKDFNITIKDVRLYSGAGFIVLYAGNILTMPGLGKKSKYEEF